MGRISVVIAISLSLLFAPVGAPQAWAQGADDKGATSTVTGPRKHLSTIVFAGIAGAILGLSTLSFYGRPQDKMNNIAIGFAIGVISGTIYTTFRAASEPREFYGLRSGAEPELWAAQAGALASQARSGELTLGSPIFVYKF